VHALDQALVSDERRRQRRKSRRCISIRDDAKRRASGGSVTGGATLRPHVAGQSQVGSPGHRRPSRACSKALRCASAAARSFTATWMRTSWCARQHRAGFRHPEAVPFAVARRW
jgi:hypothetical protein